MKLTNVVGVFASVLVLGACTIVSGDDEQDVGTGSGGSGSTGTGGSGTGGTGTGGTAIGNNEAGTDPATNTDGGSGGSSTSTDGGNTGDSGSVGNSTDVESDLCSGGAEATDNGTRETATAYDLGDTHYACLQDDDDLDFFAFTVPADPTGGYVQVSVTDVDVSGDILITVYAAANNGDINIR